MIDVTLSITIRAEEDFIKEALEEARSVVELAKTENDTDGQLTKVVVSVQSGDLPTPTDKYRATLNEEDGSYTVEEL